MANAFSSFDKLVDTLKGAGIRLGKPWFDRIDARNEAYRIKLVGEAENEVEAHKILAIAKAKALAEKAEDDTKSNPKLFLEALSLDKDSIEYRALGTTLAVATRRQENLENITALAASQLVEGEETSEEPVDPDWMARFLNYAQDISNEQMQVLWAKILAGEVKRPSSYSLQTLEILRIIDKKAADIFEEICSFSCVLKNGIILPSFIGGTNIANISFFYNVFSKILFLGEIGLIITTEAKTFIGYNETITIGDKKIKFETHEDSDLKSFDIKVFPFSNAGIQLYNMTNKKYFSEFEEEFMLHIREKMPLGVEVVLEE
jgi:hypothetical protein